MQRKILNDDEKRQVRERSPRCFLCEEDLGDPTNLIYDHIKSLIRGGTNNLSNFAAVHKECHKGKGIRDLEEYKEELRLRKVFDKFPTFAELCKEPQQFNVKIDYENRAISINGETVSLFQEPNTKLWYYYHSIPWKYLQSDIEVQPRPLDSKRLYNLASHLRNNFQLSPSVCRLILDSSGQAKLLLFDGQHKAAAQILGNLNDRVDCKVYINPPIEMVHHIVKEGHDKLRQQTFKISDMAKKYRAMLKREIELWETAHPGIMPSEKQILIDQKGLTRAQAREFIGKVIAINVKEDKDCLISKYLSEKEDKNYPMTDRMYYVNLIRHLAKLDQVEVPLESEKDFRGEEQRNICTVLNFIAIHALEGRWTPANPNTTQHQTADNMFREVPFKYWTGLLADAISFIVIRKAEDGICYGEEFSKEQLERIELACKRLFEHPLWSDPAYQATFKIKDITEIKNLFEKYRLDVMFLIKP